MTTIRILTPPEFAAYGDHLLRLDMDDRRLRFGGVVGDDGVRAFVDRLHPATTTVIAAMDSRLCVIAAVQITRMGWSSAELAFSVDAGHRRRGLGRALTARAMLWARNRGIGRVHVHCLRENLSMRRLAAEAGLQVTDDGEDSDGGTPVPLPMPATVWHELFVEAAGAMAFAAHALRRMLGLGEPAAGAAY